MGILSNQIHISLPFSYTVIGNIYMSTAIFKIRYRLCHDLELSSNVSGVGDLLKTDGFNAEN